MIDRGFTWTEQHRHECEVRYLLAMGSRAWRAAYLDGLERKRGDAAVARLKADLAVAWRAAKETPPPREDGLRPPTVGAVHLGVNEAGKGIPPGHGSLLANPHGGSSDPVTCVVSGASA